MKPFTFLLLCLVVSLAAMPTLTEVPRLFFKDFRQYDLKENKAPENIEELDGKTISVIGFMMPFDAVDNIDQFMLLQTPFMGCFHLPPPGPHETLLVKSDHLSVSYDQFPQKVTGTLHIEKTEMEGFLVSVYTIEAEMVSRADYKELEESDLPAGAHLQGN